MFLNLTNDCNGPCKYFYLCCSSSITALVTHASVCPHNLAAWGSVCATPSARSRVCVCAQRVPLSSRRATGQAADIIHLLVTKRWGCWVGSRQPLGAEDES